MSARGMTKRVSVTVKVRKGCWNSINESPIMGQSVQGVTVTTAGSSTLCWSLQAGDCSATGTWLWERNTKALWERSTRAFHRLMTRLWNSVALEALN